QDAAELTRGATFDAALFSLSYSVIPASRTAAHRAWDLLRPGGRLVVMDAGVPDSALGRILDPVARLLVKLAPGDPYSRPWEDLRLGQALEVVARLAELDALALYVPDSKPLAL